MDGLTDLKDFIDLGSTSIIAVGLLYIYFKQFQAVNDKLERILTLLAIVTKTTTNFNGIEVVLGPAIPKVNQLISEAEAIYNQPTQ